MNKYLEKIAAQKKKAKPIVKNGLRPVAYTKPKPKAFMSLSAKISKANGAKHGKRNP